GGVLWVVSLSSAGYFFGSMPIVKKNFEIVILAIIVISVLPAIVHAWKARKQSSQRGLAALQKGGTRE
ncbi:MAG: DedA family protein, partial [Phycisphaerales bacterium]|nr:DedA family protein [Phycisphaerales bacterium]